MLLKFFLNIPQSLALNLRSDEGFKNLDNII